MNILDFVDKFNLLGRLEILAGGLWYRRNAHEIRFSRYGQTSGTDAARILRERGVRVWGTRALSDWFVLHVSTQQATWAESILLTQGCALEKISAGAAAFPKLPAPWSASNSGGGAPRNRTKPSRPSRPSRPSPAKRPRRPLR